MLNGLLNLSFVGHLVAMFIMMEITILCVTLYLHRSQTHRGVDFHPAVAHVMRFWLWLTTGMITKEWVAVHRKHHATVETENDPHSPQVHGLRKVIFEGTELYRAAARNPEVIEKYGHGTPDDWLERRVYAPHSAMGILLLFIADVIFLGLPGITIWALQMMTIPFFAAGVVNGIGHFWGYRNFECEDASKNVIPWGIFLGGEELHNNHHTFATSAKLSAKWFELDIGWGVIRLLSLFKLAKVKRIPPQLTYRENKVSIDMDTVKAVLTNRFQILSQYTKEVIYPVFKSEKLSAPEKVKPFFRRAKRLLGMERKLMTHKMKNRLSVLLEARQQLKVVYQFRLTLQDIWQRTNLNPKQRLEALQTWCKQAEASGIEVLQQFAIKLRGCEPVPSVA